MLLGLIFLVAFLRPTVHDAYPWWAGFLIVVCAPALVITMCTLMRHPTLLVEEHRRLFFTPGWPWANVELAFAEVIDVRVTPRTQTLRDGSTTTLFYQVTLTHTARGAQRDLILCDYFNRDDADALVAWLRDRLGVGLPAELPLA